MIPVVNFQKISGERASLKRSSESLFDSDVPCRMMILESLLIIGIVSGGLTMIGAVLLWWYTRREATEDARELQPLQPAM